jgi:hypothetical protein
MSSLLTVIDAQRLYWKASDHCIDQLLRLSVRIPAVAAWLRANSRKWTSILDWLAMFPQVPNGAHGASQLRLMKPSRKSSTAESLLLVPGHPYAAHANGVANSAAAAAAAAGIPGYGHSPAMRTDQYVPSGLPPPRKQAVLDQIVSGKTPEYYFDESDDGKNRQALEFQSFTHFLEMFQVLNFPLLN